MIDLVKDNYMTSSGNGPSWKVNIQPPAKKIKTYFEETLEVAEYIYANSNMGTKHQCIPRSLI